MATWGLIVEMTVGTGERKHMEASVLAHVEGSREEALAELGEWIGRYTPEHPRSPKRTRIFRTADGFLLVIDGAWQTFSSRFTVAELVKDSAAPQPSPVPPPEEAAPPPAVPPEDAAPACSGPTVDRYADGVPVKPVWLGRTDLP
ncbi:MULTISPECIES: hypothetical protein [unclassified Streptomyces]|uniref:hypothetical protein n=1 Tax=unclassified Streptomyces TaxID=2593676 RepID=UPI002E2EC984|nr:hypothetical protein [Streptomyces sp. NBC_01280]WSE13196.1 hypothetical protein OG518_07700 [Streptomyces sp. NBC_01397]